MLLPTLLAGLRRTCTLLDPCTLLLAHRYVSTDESPSPLYINHLSTDDGIHPAHPHQSRLYSELSHSHYHIVVCTPLVSSVSSIDNGRKGLRNGTSSNFQGSESAVLRVRIEVNFKNTGAVTEVPDSEACSGGSPHYYLVLQHVVN